ncbi:serine hydrolase domain-containing protein [Polymorphospora sp. NPDC051019]|uniref:serine hydrolase domain-containing protein n=1 Tax=Polymorphospora sp. NPDC051019 TaxID=3155725 RepID=UPI00341C4D62
MPLTPTALREGINRVAPSVLEATSAPGALVTVGVKGQPLLTLPFGVADVSTGAPLTVDHTMRLGSLGKLLVSAAVVKLADAGRLQLDEPIDTHLPFPVTNPKGGTITLTKALAMLTGAATDGYEWTGTPEPAGEYVKRELARDATWEYGTGASRFVDSADTGQWRSSSFMYQVAPLVAEAVTGMPLGHYAKAEIFDPLGMHDTAWWDSPNWAAVRERCTTGHMLFGQHATPLPWMECAPYHSVGVVMTTSDFTKLMLALMSRGGVFGDNVVHTILEPRTTARSDVNVGLGVHTVGNPDAKDYCIRAVGHYAFGWWAVSLGYPNADTPFCVTVCTNLADQTDVFNPPEQYPFGILAYEIASWIRDGKVDSRGLGDRSGSESYVMGLVAADRFAGLMGADLRKEEIDAMADGTRPLGRRPAVDFDRDLFVQGFLDMRAAVRDRRVEEFLATDCPVGGVFRKLARKAWGSKNFDEPAPVRFWLHQLER